MNPIEIILQELITSIQKQMADIRKRRAEAGEAPDLLTEYTASAFCHVLSDYIFRITHRPEDEDRMNTLFGEAMKAREMLFNQSFFGFDSFLRSQINKDMIEYTTMNDTVDASAFIIGIYGKAVVLNAMTNNPQDLALLKRLRELYDFNVALLKNSTIDKSGEPIELH